MIDISCLHGMPALRFLMLIIDRCNWRVKLAGLAMPIVWPDMNELILRQLTAIVPPHRVVGPLQKRRWRQRLARFKLRASGRIGICRARSSWAFSHRAGRPRLSGPKRRPSPAVKAASV